MNYFVFYITPDGYHQIAGFKDYDEAHEFWHDPQRGQVYHFCTAQQMWLYTTTQYHV